MTKLLSTPNTADSLVKGQPLAGRICTQSYKAGPYIFNASLPVIGSATDMEEWHAYVGGRLVEGRFTTLEAAMMAAIANGAAHDRA